jgi:hypothetical protein
VFLIAAHLQDLVTGNFRVKAASGHADPAVRLLDLDRLGGHLMAPLRTSECSAPQRSRDDEVLDLVGAFADLEHFRIAVEPRHR